MSRPKSKRPTDRELEILQILWELGPSTGRDITTQLNQKRKTALTSVLTILQIMVDKGLVTRDESQRIHVYKATDSKEETQQTIVKDLLQQVFSGSTMHMVVSALTAKPASTDELMQIRKLLDDLEGET